jgi:hypothetical protein
MRKGGKRQPSPRQQIAEKLTGRSCTARKQQDSALCWTQHNVQILQDGADAIRLCAASCRLKPIDHTMKPQLARRSTR